MENKTLNQAQVSTILARSFLYLYAGYQVLFYLAYFSVIRDLNLFTIGIPIAILAAKYFYIKTGLHILDTSQPAPASATLSFMQIISLAYLVFVAGFSLIFHLSLNDC